MQDLSSISDRTFSAAPAETFLISEGDSDIQWAIDRLKVIATTAETSYEQCNACEQIIRCTRIIAGLVDDA